MLPIKHVALKRTACTVQSHVRHLGGCGMRVVHLSPGAPKAASSAGPTIQRTGHVAVVGAGVIGLTSALRLLQECPGIKVTVVAHSMGWQTTTAGAAGLWGPYQIWDTPPDLVSRWSSTTLDHLYDLLISEHAATAGISLRGVHLLQEEPAPPPSWSHVVDGWSPLSGRKLACLNKHRKSGKPFVQGFFYQAIACEGGFYLRWLQNQIQQLGGEIWLTAEPIRQLSQLFSPDVQGTWRPAPAPPGPSLPSHPLNPTDITLTNPSTPDAQGAAGLTLQDWLSAHQAATLTTTPPTPTPATSPATIQRGSAHTNASLPTLHQFDAVINCAGIGAKQLVGDTSVAPIRGQILRVAAPWITSAYLAGSHYVIPNTYSIVLGGTAQVENWSQDVSPHDRLHIVSGCVDMLPSLANARIIGDWVGLRPGRPAVRLELDKLSSPSGKEIPLVHNYGHGGSGLTLAWGCAGDVVQLIAGL